VECTSKGMTRVRVVRGCKEATALLNSKLDFIQSAGSVKPEPDLDIMASILGNVSDSNGRLTARYSVSSVGASSEDGLCMVFARPWPCGQRGRTLPEDRLRMRVEMGPLVWLQFNLS
jgi:hypothetical protein